MPDLSEFAYGTDSPPAAFGASAAPTAGTAIATIASGNLPNGTYDVCVVTRNSPSASGEETTDAGTHNMELRAGATVLWNRLGSDKQPGHMFVLTDVKLDGSTALSVNATANAAASTSYRATILASRNG